MYDVLPLTSQQMTSAQSVKSYCIVFVVSVVFVCCYVLPLLPTYVSLFVSSRWDLSIENQLKFVLNYCSNK